MVVICFSCEDFIPLSINMASALLEHILCPVCLSEFSDPVSLRCQHTFCRECIKAYLATSNGTGQCPECRHPFTRKHIKANRTLSNVVQAAKHQLLEQKTLEESLSSIIIGTRAQESPKRQEAPELLCPLHEERLKLFCEADQQLVCVVCRDGTSHEGHKFKPVEEKAQICKGILTGAVSFLSRENDYLDYLIRLQTAEIQKTKEMSRVWSEKISAEFKKLHQLLRDKEQKVKKHLEQEEQRVLGPMQQNLSEMSQVSARDRNTEQTLRFSLNISQPVTFMQWWTTVGCDMVEEMQDVDDDDLDEAAAESTGSTTDLQFSSKLAGWSVSQDSISLGPYETYLPFLVWRDILTDIKPVPHDEVLALWDQNYISVTRSGHSIQRTARMGLFGLYQNYRPLAMGRGAHQHGQHYWEVEVGGKRDWGAGVCVEFPASKVQEVVMLYLKHGRGYSVTAGGEETPLNLWHRPWRVGVYLDCDKGQVCFYDANTLVQLFTAVCGAGSRPLSLCLSPGAHVDAYDWDPLTVCCYQHGSHGAGGSDGFWE